MLRGSTKRLNYLSISSKPKTGLGSGVRLCLEIYIYIYLTIAAIQELLYVQTAMIRASS